MTDIQEIAQGIVKVHKKALKPMACYFMGASDVQVGIDILEQAHIPHYILPELACKAMANVQRVCKWRQTELKDFEPLPVDRRAAAGIIDELPEGYLREDQALAVLQAYGLSVPKHKLCKSPDEAADFAQEIGFPVVLRVVSSGIVHKYDVKGVALNLENAEQLKKTYKNMMDHIAKLLPDAQVTGVLVRGMIPAGHEVILGAKRDAVFGPTLMFGLGGLFVETFKDVTFALAPVDQGIASRMVRQIKAIGLLKGARGAEPADIAAIEQSLRRLGQLISDFERIRELDINPLIVAPAGQGAAVADVRIRLDG